MNINNLVERVLILALLFITFLQLGGAAVPADTLDVRIMNRVKESKAELAGHCCQMVGFPHNDIEACQMLMQFFH